MKEFLPAIDELIEGYSKFHPLSIKNFNEECPLCLISRGITAPWDSCNVCPWQKIERGYCKTDHNYHQDRTFQRISRLKRWKEIIENENK